MKKEKNTGLSVSNQKKDILTGEYVYVASAEVKKASAVKKIKYGGVSVAFTVVFIIAIALLNIVLSYLDTRFVLKKDFTAEKVFSLSDETISLLEELDKKNSKAPIEIIVLGDESIYRSTDSYIDYVSLTKYVTETLDNYIKSSKSLSLKFIDPTYNPGFFKTRGIELNDGTDTAKNIFIVVYSPETGRYKTIKDTVFSDLEYVGLERRITSGLMYVSLDTMSKIGFATGHGEQATAYFYEVLKDNGFDIFSIDFSDKTMKAIPDEISMLVICNPSRGYSADDISLIDKWLSSDGDLGHHLMVFEDLGAYSDSRLHAYFGEWGIALGSDNIFDTQASGNVYTLQNAYCPILRSFYAENASSFIGSSSNIGTYQNLQLGKVREVSAVYDEKDDIKTTAILSTSPSSFGHYTASAGSISIDNFADYCKKKEFDTDGPFDIMITARKSMYDEAMAERSSTVTVCGSISPVDDYFMSNVDGANEQTAAFMIKLVRSLTSATQSIDSLVLPDKLIFDTLSFDSEQQLVGIVVSITAGVPVLLCAVGLFVMIKRKHL